MRFGLLGELVVWRDDGDPVHIGGPRQRALLALLMLNANRPVSADLLIDEVWPDRAEGSVGALKVAVSRLRRTLELEPRASAGQQDIPQRIVTRANGYLLRIADDELDSVEFERELAASRAASSRGDEATALGDLRHALGRWRGNALDEFRDRDWARVEARRLEHLRVEALEHRVGIELSLGRHADVVAELEGLTAKHPERERLHASLMVALYRSGRQIDALAVYRRLREHLVDEFGVEPGKELRQLHQQILAQERALTPNVDHDGRAEPQTHGVRLPPLTSRLRVDSDLAFVGREPETALLDCAVADRGETVRTVLVSGEPGIGKTRLVSEFAARSHARGIAVAGGRCDSDLGLPYQPFVEALDDLLRWAPPDLLDRKLELHGPVLATIVPRLVTARPNPELGQTPSQELDGTHYRLFAAVGDLLAALTRIGPLVLVLEDLHWADEPTVLLLKHVLTMPNVESLTVVVTYRSTEVDERPLAELVAQLHREAGVQRITLTGLAEFEVIELVRAQTGTESDQRIDEVARRLRQDTDGNPFFLAQLLQSPSGLRPAPRSDMASTGDTVPPVSLRETITARIARLGTDVDAFLTAAAIAGDEFDLRVLRELSVLPEKKLVRAVDAALGERLLLEADGAGSRLAFVHALVPQVLRNGLSAVRRRALHRDVAGAMERLHGEDGGDQVAALAHHWRQGCEPPDVEPAIRTARLAARQALERLAPAEAVRWYQAALRLHTQQRDPGESATCELLIRLGESERQAGDGTFRETLLDAAKLASQLGDSGLLVEATLANTRGFTSATGRIDSERIAMLEVALGSIPQADSPERARLLAAQAVELAFCGEREKPRVLSDEALAIARRCGEDAALARVLAVRFFAIWTPDTLPLRLAESAENVRICERLGDPLAQSQALHWRANACIEAGDMASARRCIERVRDFSILLREPTVMWQSAYNTANLSLALGELDEAEQLASVALELGQSSGQPDALPVFAAQLSSLRFDQGRLGDLIPLIVQVLSDHAEITGFRALLALAHCEQDELENARGAFAHDAERRFASVAYDVTWLSVLCIYAHVCSRLFDRESAATLLEMLTPWGDQVAVSVVGWGCVAHYVGMLAATLEDYDSAVANLSRAVETHQRMCTPIWAARTELETARMLVRRAARGDRARSRDAAERALARARKHRCATVERDATALLAGPFARR